MTQDSKLDLSIILVNWNSHEVTREALKSIERHVGDVGFETIVVDNGTTKDDGPDLIEKEFPGVKLIRNKENLGFSKANNQGIRIAKGRYVLLLNNDTAQTENAMKKAVAFMDENPRIGALGILHRNADATNTPQRSWHCFPKPWREIGDLIGLGGGKERAAPEPAEWTKEREVDWVCGSFLMMPRECLDGVGLLDERFFIYDEDVDWCLRARRAGWRVYFWPGAEMIHVGSAARPHMRDKTFVHFRSHLSYFAKNHSKAAAVGYYAAMGIRLSLSGAGALLRLARGRVGWSDVAERWRRLVQFVFLHPGRRGG